MANSDYGRAIQRLVGILATLPSQNRSSNEDRAIAMAMAFDGESITPEELDRAAKIALKRFTFYPSPVEILGLIKADREARRSTMDAIEVEPGVLKLVPKGTVQIPLLPKPTQEDFEVARNRLDQSAARLGLTTQELVG